MLRAIWRGRRRRILFGAFAAAMATAVWIRVGPIPADLLADTSVPSSVVVDRHGRVLYEALSADGVRGMTLTSDQLPPVLVNATVAAEDHRFWSHPGIDPIAIARALKTNLAENRVVEGGSTISQQVAKLLLNRRDPDRDRGVMAKLREAVLALRLEHRFSKQEILARYLNLAAYGNQMVGAERASRGYFGKPSSMLTPAQAAFLAGLPQRPSRFNPHRHRDLAIARQQSVLRRMQHAGVLSAEEAVEARGERLVFTPAQPVLVAPHFVEMVLSSFAGDRPPRIVTTLDRDLQMDVAGVIASHRDELRAHGASNVAVVVLDNATGEWLAWEGSGVRGDDHGAAINGVVMPRQPGSALKPLTYAIAFEHRHSPASVLADLPAHFPTADPGVVYSPRNYDGQYRGPLLARRALAGSLNVPAVALAAEVGVPTLLRFLGRAGFTTFDRTPSYYGLGLTLGNAEVRLDEMVGAYAAFARGGEWRAPVFVPRDARPREPVRRLVSARTAFWITDILSDADAREFVFGRGGSLEFPFPVAVKTGTSQAYHDNWTVGYSRRVTVGVWVGNFDRTPLRNSSGVTGAAPIFHAVMLAAERRLSGAPADFESQPIVPPPTTVVSREICAQSGSIANPWCPLRQHEWLARETDPRPCSWHHQHDGDVLTILPAEYRAWAAERMPAGTLPSRSAAVARASRQDDTTLRIVNPPEGATYWIDPTLRREFQALAFKAVTPGRGRVEWLVDGAPIGSAEATESVSWPLTPGTHRITARDGRGSVAETTIRVR